MPSPVPPPCGSRDAVGDLDWQAWFRNLGREVRTMRQLLGLTQDQLARLAGVSQGAVSRFETGPGLATPAVVLFRIATTLTQECGRAPGSLLTTRLVQMLDGFRRAVPASACESTSVARDTQVEELIRLFRGAAPWVRRVTLVLLRSLTHDAGAPIAV